MPAAHTHAHVGGMATSSSAVGLELATSSNLGAESGPPLRLSLSLNRSKSGMINPVAGTEEDTHNGATGYANRPVAGKAAGEKKPTFKFTFS